jgi:hypothetical protein
MHKLNKSGHLVLLGLFLIGYTVQTQAQHSVARQWNEILLQSIRDDFARPTVHARNLFHLSAAMYDAWAVYDPTAETYFLGKQAHGFSIPFEGISPPADVQAAQEEAMSYAAFRLLNHRFKDSPGSFFTNLAGTELMMNLGYDASYFSTDYASGGPAALGNYLAQAIISYGHQDGSNEQNNYGNRFYETINPGLDPTDPGNPDLIHPNRWQPLQLGLFIDQSGQPIDGEDLPFLSPEWGYVNPFAMTEEDKTIFERDGELFPVYHDPGEPAYLDTLSGAGNTAEYQWGHTLVSIWSAHLDPGDSVMWDISPASIGNIASFPTTLPGLRDFYQDLEGGDIGQGHALNPHTNQPYEPQMVPRADYARVLAEFWADGPDSETPPGHWFTILNYVSDHPELVKRFKGEGPVLDALEWDVKAYFALGGAVHDAAIAAWGIKGYYDYIRPISAIRWMAEQGQSSDPNLPRYSPLGIPLTPGYVELVQEGDTLAGANKENVGKIKLYAWRGPDYIENPETDFAGVGWILADNWWPYQRPTFVTPPFAGYVSGHSTFSRAAAEVMTLLTGDPFFPGGMGEFVARKNAFLVFEEGPSVDLVLQWATYRDASDQTSLSRIWGGIHPPVDDIPGRIIGEEVGVTAFALAEKYFEGASNGLNGPALTETRAFPNPVAAGEALTLSVNQTAANGLVQIVDLAGRPVHEESFELNGYFAIIQVWIPPQLNTGLYQIRILTEEWEERFKVMVE